MFSRSFVRTGARAVGAIKKQPPTFTATRVNALRGFTNSATKKDPEVPLVTFQGGERVAKSINIEADASAVVTPAGADAKREAQALDPSIVGALTPTLSKFCVMGKVAVVTGGGRGLGENMCQALLESGIRGIAMFDVQQELGEAVAQEMSEQTGADVRFYKIDVRDGAGVAQAVKDAYQHFGQLDIVVNAAGIADSNIKAEGYDLEKFRRLIDINVTGTFVVNQAVAKYMIASGKGGSIVNIASMSGSVVNYPQEQSAYNASKAAVIQLTKSLAAEWARYKIRVNAISPGYMDTALNRVPALDAQKKIWTDLTPQKRLGNVDDLNGLAVYLASDASGFMTGSNLIIDGGYTLW